MSGKKILCLAGGGGQQGPILAAAGADVIVFDNSDKQLEKDRFVASRDNLQIKTVQGNMPDLQLQVFMRILGGRHWIGILRHLWQLRQLKCDEW